MIFHSSLSSNIEHQNKGDNFVLCDVIGLTYPDVSDTQNDMSTNSLQGSVTSYNYYDDQTNIKTLDSSYWSDSHSTVIYSSDPTPSKPIFLCKKTGRPSKNDKEKRPTNIRRDLRIDNLRLKLINHMLNSVVSFVNCVVSKYFNEHNLGKADKFLNLSTKIKKEKELIKNLKELKIGEILRKTGDKRLTKKDEKYNEKLYNKVKDFTEISAFFNMSFSEFIRSYYLKSESEFEKLLRFSKGKNEFFYCDLVKKNKDRGKMYLSKLDSIVKMEMI